MAVFGVAPDDSGAASQAALFLERGVESFGQAAERRTGLPERRVLVEQLVDQVVTRFDGAGEFHGSQLVLMFLGPGEGLDHAIGGGAADRALVSFCSIRFKSTDGDTGLTK